MSTALAYKIHQQTNCGRDIIDMFARVHSDPDEKPFHRNRASRYLLGQGWGKPPKRVYIPGHDCELDVCDTLAHIEPQQTDGAATADSADPGETGLTPADSGAETAHAPVDPAPEPAPGATPIATGNTTLAQQMAEGERQLDDIRDNPIPGECDQPIVPVQLAQIVNLEPSVAQTYYELGIYEPALEELHPLARYVRSITNHGHTIIRSLTDIYTGRAEAVTTYDHTVAGTTLLERSHGTDRSPLRRVAPQIEELLQYADSDADPESDSHSIEVEQLTLKLCDLIRPAIDDALQSTDPEHDGPTHTPDYSEWMDIEYNYTDVEPYIEEVNQKAAERKERRRIRLELLRTDRERIAREESEAQPQPDHENRAEPDNEAEEPIATEDPAIDVPSGDYLASDPRPPPPEAHGRYYDTGMFRWELRDCRHPRCHLHRKTKRYIEDIYDLTDDYGRFY